MQFRDRDCARSLESVSSRAGPTGALTRRQNGRRSRKRDLTGFPEMQTVPGLPLIRGRTGLQENRGIQFARIWDTHFHVDRSEDDLPSRACVNRGDRVRHGSVRLQRCRLQKCEA